MKKKLLISLLALSGVVALTSCGENDKPNDTSSSGSVESLESSKSTSSKQEESVSSKPSESSTSKPGESSTSKPGESSTSKPGESSTSKPSESSTSKPSESSSSSTSTPSLPSESSSVNEKANVTFEVDGVKIEASVDKGNTVNKPADPTKEGYVFEGWFNGEEEFDFSTPIITDEVNIVARFRKLTDKELFYKTGEVLYYSEFTDNADVTYSATGGEGLTGYAQDTNTKENKPFTEANIVNIANGMLNLVDTDTVITTYASIDLKDIYLDKVTFVCDLVPSKVAGKWSMVTFVDAKGKEIAAIRTTSDKKLGVRISGTDPTTGVAYTENQKMKIVVVIDLCAEKISATVDGTSIAVDASINANNLAGIKFGTAKDARNLSLDNVGIKKEACTLEAAKMQMNLVADNIYAGYDFENYKTNQENITNTYNQAKANIDSASSVTEVLTALEAFKEALKEYPSDAEIALDLAKRNAISEISNYLDQDNYKYSTSDIEKIITDITDKINNAKTTEDINSLVVKAKEALDAVPNDIQFLENLRTRYKNELDSLAQNYLETSDFASKLEGYKALLDSKTTQDEINAVYEEIKAEIAAIPTDKVRAQNRRTEAIIELFGAEEFSEDLLATGSGAYRVDDIIALKDTNNDVYQLIVGIFASAKERLDDTLKTSEINTELDQIKIEIDTAIASTTKPIEDVRAESIIQIKVYATEILEKDTFKDFAKLSEAINNSDNVAEINQIVLDAKDIIDVWKYINTKGTLVEEAFDIYNDDDYKNAATGIANAFYEEDFAVMVNEEGRYAYNVEETTAKVDSVAEFYKTNKVKLLKGTTDLIDEYFEKFTNAENETVARCVSNLDTFKKELSKADNLNSYFISAKDEAGIESAFNTISTAINNIMNDAINLSFEAAIYVTAGISSKYSVKYGEKINLADINKAYKAKNILIDSLYLNEELSEEFAIETIIFNMDEGFTLYAKAYDISVTTEISSYGFVNPTVATPTDDDVFTYVGIDNGVVNNKNFIDTDKTTLTNAIKTGGGTNKSRYIQVVLTSTKTLKAAFFTGSANKERSVFVAKTITKALDTSIAYASSSVQTEISSFEVDLEAGTYYVNFTDNVSIFRLEIIDSKEKTTVYNFLDASDVKTSYASGEAIDLTGLKANKTVDGTASTVQLTKEEIAKATYQITNENGEAVTELTTGSYKVSVKFLNLTIVEYWITVE